MKPRGPGAARSRPSWGGRLPPAARGAVAVVMLLLLPVAAVPPHPFGTPPRPVAALAGPTPATSYSLKVAAPGLPASDLFSFEIDGGLHVVSGGAVTTIAGLAGGLHTIGNLSGTPAASGWGFFGRSSVGSTFLLPGPTSINLSFAYVNLTAAPGEVHLLQQHIPAGLRWQLSFNGTVLAATTPEINVSVRPGNYPVVAESSLNAVGTTNFSAPDPMPFAALAPGDEITLNYSLWFACTLGASPGGQVNIQEGNLLPLIPPGTHWYRAGANLTIYATGTPTTRFVTWTGTGAGSYSGPEPRRTFFLQGPTVEIAEFAPVGPDRDAIRAVAAGIPVGVAWSVFLDGAGYTTVQTVLVVPSVLPCTNASNPSDPGLYSVYVPWAYVNATPSVSATRYVPGPYPAAVCGGSIFNLTFSPQYLLTVSATAGGSVTTSGSPSSSTWVAPGETVGLVATPDPGYRFVGWNGSGPGNVTSFEATTTVTPTGPVTELASFAPIGAEGVRTYSLTLVASPAPPAGTAWSATVNGTTWLSSTSQIEIPGLAPGTYPVTVGNATTPDALGRFAPVVPTFAIPVPNSSSWTVNFVMSYWVDVVALGPGRVGPASGWFPAGASLTLTATPTSGGSFAGWQGQGTQSYNGTRTSWSTSVGGPLIETATFVAPPPVPVDVWQRPATLGAIGIAAVAVGALLGIVRFGVPRRRPGPRRSPRDRAPPPTGGGSGP